MLSLILALCTIGGDVTRAVPIPLSTLTSECRIARSPVNRFGASQTAAVIDCGCYPHVITSPVSLEGLVDIRTGDNALEFVRVFSSIHTFDLFEMGGVVEIAGFGESNYTEDGRFLIDDEFKPTFGRQFRPPTVIEETQFGEKRFRIQRVVAGTDGKVYELDEYVSQAGVYRVLKRRLLLSAAAKIGILHFGDL